MSDNEEKKKSKLLEKEDDVEDDKDDLDDADEDYDANDASDAGADTDTETYVHAEMDPSNTKTVVATTTRIHK